MQEVFEKIKERLKKESHLAREDGERYLKGNENQFLYARARGYEVAMENAIEIVNQVAEEYNQSLANNNQLLTNADKIRSMSNEELAEFLPIVSNYMCQPTDKCREIILNRGECCKTKECALCWLQQEVEG